MTQIDIIPGEIWKSIPGYEEQYAISNKGRVKTLQHKVYNPAVLGDGNYRTVPEKIRKPNIMKGYYCIGLTVDGHVKVFRIHRLVAETFIGPQPSPEHQVNHIDGHKENNCVENLEWVTPKENTQHAIRSGLIHPPSEETRRKMSDASKKVWTRHNYRESQKLSAQKIWKDPEKRARRIEQITNGIHMSNSQRYLRNRKGDA